MATATSQTLKPAAAAAPLGAARPGLVALITFFVWLLLAASAVAWWLRVSSPPGEPMSVAAPVPALAVDVDAVARALGAKQAAPVVGAAQGARLVLQGVLAAHPSGAGVALIAVDGAPPMPVRTGRAVGDGWVLQSVTTRTAKLGASADGPASMELELAQSGAPSGATGPNAAGGVVTAPAFSAYGNKR